MAMRWLLLGLLISGASAEERSALPLFHGMCDASAAVAIGPDRFIVADDEDNLLRIYSRNGGQPLVECDVSGFLGLIIAGPFDDGGSTRLFEWNGRDQRGCSRTFHLPGSIPRALPFLAALAQSNTFS